MRITCMRHNIRRTASLLVVIGIFIIGSSAGDQGKTQKKEPLKLTGKVESEVLNKTIQKAIDFLKSKQDDKSWRFDGKNIAGLGAMVTPLCLTAMACMALSFHSADLDKSSSEAIERGLNFILNNKHKKKTDDALTWSFAPILSFMTHQLGRETSEEMRVKIKDYAAHVVECIGLCARKNGGWDYTKSKTTTSSLTGGILAALLEAKAAGIDVPAKLIENTAAEIERCKSKDGGYDYYGPGARKEDNVAGYLKASMGRLCACELALFLIGRRKAEDLNAVIETFLKNRGHLDRVRGNSGAHVKSEHWNASYYFLFGHYYAARLCRYLDAETHKKVIPYLQEVFILTQDSDGSWIDHPAVGKTYGVAMGLLTLGELQAPLIKAK